jgi:hypothetical protein
MMTPPCSIRVDLLHYSHEQTEEDPSSITLTSNSILCERITCEKSIFWNTGDETLTLATSKELFHWSPHPSQPLYPKVSVWT